MATCSGSHGASGPGGGSPRLHHPGASESPVRVCARPCLRFCVLSVCLLYCAFFSFPTQIMASLCAFFKPVSQLALPLEPYIEPFLRCLSVLLYFSISFIWQQAYLKRTEVGGLVRMELQPAALNYRWADGTAPYCLGATPTASSRSQGYDFPTPGFYRLLPGGLVFPQYFCQYLDQEWELFERSLFVATRKSYVEQELRPAGTSCATLAHSYCKWGNSSDLAQNVYIPDVELFTLLLDHNIVESDGRFTNAKLMAGRALLRTNQIAPGPCSASYASSSCPSSVSFGESGRNDIVPLSYLLYLAGVHSLDDASFSQNETLRYSGSVLSVSLEYSNSFVDTRVWALAGSNTFTYTLRAALLPDTSYRVVTNTMTPEAPSFSNRTETISHGMRIAVSQVAHIYSWDWQLAIQWLTGLWACLEWPKFLTKALAAAALGWHALRQALRGALVWIAPTPKSSSEEGEKLLINSR